MAEVSLAPLFDRLGRARTRAGYSLLLVVCLAGVTGGSAALALVFLVQTRVPLPTLLMALLAFAGAATGAVPALLGGLARLPSVTDLARRADRLLETDAEVTTAVETALAAGGTSNASSLVRLLWQRVAQRATAIDPALLVPLRLGRLLVAPFLAVAIAGSLAVLTVPYQTEFASMPSPALSEPETLRLGAELEALAGEMEQEAKTTANAYAAAVARETRNLARALASATPPDRRALSAALDRIAAYAGPALARPDSALPQAPALERLTSLRKSLDGQLPTPAPDAATEVPSESVVDGAGPAREATAKPGQAGNDAPAPERRAQPRQLTGELGLAQVDDNFCDFETDNTCQVIRSSEARPSGMGDQAADAAATPNARHASDLNSGFVIGPSPSSRAGDSTQAGTGLADLTGPGTAAALEAATQGEMLLGATNALGEGRHMRIDLAPDEAGEGLPEGNRIGQRNWRRRAEAPVARQRLSPLERGVLKRYFPPPAEAAP